MSFGDIWWFWRDSGPDSLREPLEALVEGGLSRENKELLEEDGFGGPFWIDQKGREQPWDERYILDRWNSGEPLLLIMYLADDAEMIISARRAEGVISLGLDGYHVGEARRAAQIAISVALSFPGTRGLVIDPDMKDNGDEFNRFVSGETNATPYRPTVLMLPDASGEGFNIAVKPGSWFHFAKAEEEGK